MVDLAHQRRQFGLDDGAQHFYGCAFMNAAAEHMKGNGDDSWLREMIAGHHAAIVAFLCSLAEADGYGEPRVLARQLLLVIHGAIAAMMASRDKGVLDIADRDLHDILAARRR